MRIGFCTGVDLEDVVEEYSYGEASMNCQWRSLSFCEGIQPITRAWMDAIVAYGYLVNFVVIIVKMMEGTNVPVQYLITQYLGMKHSLLHAEV